MTPDDDALDRLRAADPAAGTEPDLVAIRAAVAAATGVPLAGLPAAAPDELAARRRRTRVEWSRAAAAVVAVAVLGTGGYLAAGSAGQGASASATGALPAISLQGTTTGGLGTGDQAARLPASGNVAGAGAASSSVASSGVAGGGTGYGASMPAYGGRTVFQGTGLSGAGGRATAWGFDAASVASADTAARIAAALGVAGSPQLSWGSWVVGPNDGSGPTVSLDGSGQVSFYDPRRDPWQCQGGASVGGKAGGGSGTTGSGSATSGGVAVAVPPAAPAPATASGANAVPLPAATPGSKGVPAPGPADRSVCAQGTTPTGDAATARARAALTSIGIDTTGTQVQSDDTNDKGAGSTGAGYVYRSFQQVVDGQLTGVTWNVTLVGDGVQGLGGPLAPLVSLGSYDVVSPAEAADRLNDPRFGSVGGGVYPLEGRAVASGGQGIGAPVPAQTISPSQAPTVPPAPAAGAAISWPVQHVTLTSSRLGLALMSQANGAQVLVPAYQLTDTAGTTWSVVAVVDAQLDFGR